MNTGGRRGGTSEHFLLGYSSQKNLEHFTVYKQSPGKAGWAWGSKQRRSSGAPNQQGGLRPQTNLFFPGAWVHWRSCPWRVPYLPGPSVLPAPGTQDVKAGAPCDQV